MPTDNIFIGRIAYNNGTKIASALNTDNISLAVNNSVNFSTLNWCASCGVCNEYTIITDSYFLSKTTLENVRAMCYCTNSTDLNILLSEINNIASTIFEGPFADLQSAMTWIEDNGLFITNQNYPSIVTDGNVLHLDGGLPASYPLVGTSWYDLTENSNNGVLINGVTYNSSVKGYLVFNGSNQYVSVSGNTNIPIGNSNYTIGVWFNADTLGDKGLVGWGNYGTTNEVNEFKLTSSGLTNSWQANDLSVTTTITPGNWYYAVATFNGTTRSIYVNGSLVGSDTPTGHNVTTSSNLTIGVTNNTGYFDGDIGDFQIFDRAITPTEILQNYNSFVTRYNGTNTEICLTPIYCDNTPTPTPNNTTTPTTTPTQTQTGTPSSTGTTPTPTTTQTPTPTSGSSCNCEYYGFTISALDVESSYNSTVYADYFPCDGEGAVTATYTFPGAGIYTDTICVYSFSIPTPDPFLYYYSSSPEVTKIPASNSSFEIGGFCCDIIPTPTVTPTSTSTPTPTATTTQTPTSTTIPPTPTPTATPITWTEYRIWGFDTTQRNVACGNDDILPLGTAPQTVYATTSIASGVTQFYNSQSTGNPYINANIVSLGLPGNAAAISFSTGVFPYTPRYGAYLIADTGAINSVVLCT